MDVFGALADDVRRDLVLRLARGGPARVVDLAAVHPISRPAISRHLRVLQEAGLCSAEDRGRERHYRFEPSGLAPVRSLLDAASVGPPVTESVLDALDLEVRRTVRDRRTADTGEQEEVG
jgi:DNA-binding transcriptional ArsR family regulator